MSAAGGFRSTGGGVVAQVVALLGAGRSVHESADTLGLPDGFIEQVADEARRRGLLDIVELDTGCSSGSCSPDPRSVVCAGCPLASGRKGLLGSLLRQRHGERRTIPRQ